MKSNEVKFISTTDWILASITTVLIVGIFIALRYAFGLELIPSEISPEDRALVYIISVLFTFLYILLIENILRWSRLLITKLGKRSYDSKHIGGFPVNESFIGYKYIDSKIVIKETSELINETNDMDFFEEVVWFANMEIRQKAYNRLLRDFRRKLSKSYKKAKKKRLESEFGVFEEELTTNRKHIQWTVDMLEVINSHDREQVIELDTMLYEIYSVDVREFDAQALLDDDIFDNLSWIDKIRNSKVYGILTTWVFPVMIGVSFIILGFMYEWKFDDVLSESDKILLNLLVFYLITKIPTTALKAFTSFPRNILKPVQDSSWVFRKYKQAKANNRDKDN